MEEKRDFETFRQLLLTGQTGILDQVAAAKSEIETALEIAGDTEAQVTTLKASLEAMGDSLANLLSLVSAVNSVDGRYLQLVTLWAMMAVGEYEVPSRKELLKDVARALIEMMNIRAKAEKTGGMKAAQAVAEKANRIVESALDKVAKAMGLK